MLSITAIAQDNMSSQARIFRDDIKQFLQEEGFSPTVDGDEIDFKKEGVSYWINFEGTSPVLVSLRLSGYTNEYDSEIAMLKATNYANFIKGSAKAFLYKDNSVGFAVQHYYKSAEEFKMTFYKNMSDIDKCKDNLTKKYNELNGSPDDKSTTPFEISAVFVANVTQSGDIISDYGKSIYSNSTQYIKPRIYIDTKKEGEFEIFVKFFSPDGLSSSSSSPDGYSYKQTVTLSKNTPYYTISGWGSSTSGHWKAGEYRMEFYYKGKLIFTKKFNIQ